MWNLWKERNWHIFEHKLQLAQQVAERMKGDLLQYNRLFSNTGLFSVNFLGSGTGAVSPLQHM